MFANFGGECICEHEKSSVMQVTVSVILDTRRMKKGTYPLKLQVTYQRKTRHYPTIFNLLEGDYQKLTSPRIGAELQRVRDGIKRIERKAEEFAEDLQAFSFILFLKDFVNQHNLLRRRKLDEEEEQMETADDFDFKPYLKRFPCSKKRTCQRRALVPLIFTVSRISFARSASAPLWRTKTPITPSSNSSATCCLRK